MATASVLGSTELDPTGGDNSELDDPDQVNISESEGEGDEE
jgi:hypothetical protein